MSKPYRIEVSVDDLMSILEIAQYLRELGRALPPKIVFAEEFAHQITFGLSVTREQIQGTLDTLGGFACALMKVEEKDKDEALKEDVMWAMGLARMIELQAQAQGWLGVVKGEKE